MIFRKSTKLKKTLKGKEGIIKTNSEEYREKLFDLTNEHLPKDPPELLISCLLAMACSIGKALHGGDAQKGYELIKGLFEKPVDFGKK